MPLISLDGRTQVCTDGGTDMPHDRRLRPSGIVIFGGGTSSWQYSCVLGGPIQMNDKAETAAAVLLAEAVEQQIAFFPYGVEVFIDNTAVCETAQAIAQGVPARPTGFALALRFFASRGLLATDHTRMSTMAYSPPT